KRGRARWPREPPRAVAALGPGAACPRSRARGRAPGPRVAVAGAGGRGEPQTAPAPCGRLSPGAKPHERWDRPRTPDTDTHRGGTGPRGAGGARLAAAVAHRALLRGGARHGARWARLQRRACPGPYPAAALPRYRGLLH